MLNVKVPTRKNEIESKTPEPDVTPLQGFSEVKNLKGNFFVTKLMEQALRQGYGK